MCLVLTCPPTTAIAGKESHRVGRAFSSPWSPRAVQALWSLFTNEIKLSMPPPDPTLPEHNKGEEIEEHTDQITARSQPRPSHTPRSGRKGFEANRESFGRLIPTSRDGFIEFDVFTVGW